ncbi:MFS transporter [Mycetocola zhadangensis]|uniref:MFS transporter n=1 Tax=Mycetocola zhadangensis TaxID=1164595 RepID=A0A3L7J1S2_9MICO|nr:MFS transporter [Mycetocola zhadangensis]RLQ84506.1 MFS transporter [Mycetocola zhadangensis]GGE92375.1 MFS transporter [Mycetocola zhadangensis]
MSETSPHDAPADRVKWQSFWVCAGVACLTILDLSKVNVGLTSIEESLGGGATELQLIVAGYALAFGLALVPSGRLGDLRSRRNMFLIGLTSFMLASLLCAVAPTIEVLVIGRILQGVAAGIQMPQVLGLIQQLFQGQERGKAFGLFGATIGLSTAFGPTIGGLLIGIGGPENGWRLLFWMNIPLGLIAIWFAWRLLPKHQAHEGGTGNLDVPGIVLLGIATFSLMLPFVLTTGGPTDDPNRWYWLVGFVLAAAAFVWWERRYLRIGKSPVVHFGLLRLASYRNGILIATAYFAAIPAMFLIVTLFLQQGLGLEAVFAGMVSIPFALASAATSWIGGRLVNRHGRKIVVLGVALAGIGIAATLPISAYASEAWLPWLMAAVLTIAGAGGGFVISPNQTLTLQDVPVTQGGVAGSVAQVGQRVGTAIGVAVASSTFFATLYAGQGLNDSTEVYREAFGRGTTIIVALLVIALVLSLLDLRKRKTPTA